MIPARTYASVLQEVLEKTPTAKWEEVAKRFVVLLKKTGRLGMASKIMHDFRKLWMERKGKKALVVSTHPLSEKTKKETEEILGKKGFLLQEQLDKGIIGGAILFLGQEYMIDNSIKGKLQKIERYLHG